MNKFSLPPVEYCYYLDENSHTFVNLSTEQHLKVQQLCDMITRENHTKFIYRADDRVSSIYNASVDSVNFAECFFMIGEKGNEFLREINYTDKLEEYASKLFKQLYDFVNGINLNGAVENRLQPFYQENEAFVNFFKNVQNKSAFISALSSSAKWIINDYYEMFLHTIRRNGINNTTSAMLSTTLDICIAKRFRHHNGILIVGWVMDSGVIKFRNVNRKEETIQRLGLPTYKESLFPEQKEICLKYGLPPHNILGFFNDDNYQHFIINHHLLCEQKNIDYFGVIHRRGMYINQENFLEYLGLTKYKRGFRLVANEYTYLH